jgi:hypothetical protein
MDLQLSLGRTMCTLCRGNQMSFYSVIERSEEAGLLN